MQQKLVYKSKKNKWSWRRLLCWRSTALTASVLVLAAQLALAASDSKKSSSFGTPISSSSSSDGKSWSTAGVEGGTFTIFNLLMFSTSVSFTDWNTFLCANKRGHALAAD
ncbi:hypothetical protein TNCT_129891 [Trichonephila clavata]|uniref:Uncharacterized protein n=1 Tax=Trichonephila clavata TaxID=2740835 RepID=A0A8X6FNN6_TRICU|nr:hypothetical protein TNCT_129891 [Trichonephila clavata]